MRGGFRRFRVLMTVVALVASAAIAIPAVSAQVPAGSGDSQVDTDSSTGISGDFGDRADDGSQVADVVVTGIDQSVVDAEAKSGCRERDL